MHLKEIKLSKVQLISRSVLVIIHGCKTKQNLFHEFRIFLSNNVANILQVSVYLIEDLFVCQFAGGIQGCGL